MMKRIFLTGLFAALLGGLTPLQGQLTLASMTATTTDFTTGDYLVGLHDDLSDEIKVALTSPLAEFLSSDADFDFINTWNDGGTLFTALDLNITDTASDANSILLDLRVGGTSQFRVTKSGVVTGTGTFDGVDLADLLTAVGIASGGTSLGTFTGGTITDNSTVKTAIQELETAHEVTAGGTFAYAAKTASYTVVASDYFIDVTANTVTITLPTAVGITGKVYVIENSGAGTVTVDPDGSETLDGSATLDLTTQYSDVQIISDGANWKAF